MTVFSPPEPRGLPSARLARRRGILLDELEAGRVRSGWSDLPSAWRARPASTRIVLVLAVLLLLGAVGTAVGIGIRLVTQEERFHDVVGAQGGGPEIGPFHEVVAGEGWALLAATSDEGICVDLAVPGRSATSCGFPVSGSAEVVGALVTDLTGGLVVAGPADAKVDRVDVELADGSVLAARVFDPPAGLGLDLRFFLLEVPVEKAGGLGIGAAGALRAYDADGALLERFSLTDTER